MLDKKYKYSTLIIFSAIVIFTLLGVSTLDKLLVAGILAAFGSFLSTHSNYLYGFLAFEAHKALKKDESFNVRDFGLRFVIMLSMLSFFAQLLEGTDTGYNSVVFFILGGSTVLILSIFKDIVNENLTTDNIKLISRNFLSKYIDIKPVTVKPKNKTEFEEIELLLKEVENIVEEK